MATAGAVLGVIRAARPNLRTATERVAFAVHAAFLAAGYSIVAVGAAVDTSGAEEMEEAEVGFEGWNDLEEAYAFRYSGAGQPGLCRAVTVKLVVMANTLMIDAAPPNSDALLHLKIRATDFAKDGEAVNYAQQFISLEDLVEHINVSLLTKLSPTITAIANPAAASSSSAGQSEPRNDARRTAAPPSILTPGVHFLLLGNSDHFPRHGGGIFAPRRDFGSDGMLVGPNDLRWGRPSGGSQPGTPDFGQAGVPPGARFDPFGPPSTPGFHDDYMRPTPRLPEGHPDLEFFQQ